MVFVMRKLDRTPKTLGEKLRALRRGQAVSLDMIEKATHIQRSYLTALEKGYYDELPEPMYTRQFIRAYARELGADEQYFLELYDEECGRCDLVKPMQTPRQKVRLSRFFVWNRFVQIAVLGLLVVGIVGYLAFQVRDIIAPPSVVLLTPEDESMTNIPTILVDGYVDTEATVYINGDQVVLNSDFSFESQIDLQQGLNVIVVEAERRYSRRARVERHVVFDPQKDVF